jgi:glycosyltransferase involved in cell wall biosynthesis
MKKNYISILITNHNKNKYLKKNIKSCLNQDYDNFEVIVYDDRSTDNSVKTLKKFKKIKLIQNNTNYYFPPLNQIEGLMQAFKKSRGNIICLLDADDYFYSDKLKLINSFFNLNKKKNIAFDIPFSKYKNFQPKTKKHYYSIWPSIVPTSGISLRRKTLKNFFMLSEIKKHQHLEIDSRIMIFSYHFLNEINFIKKKITYYNIDENGISSKYKKFSKLWWYKRIEAFNYLKYILKKKNKDFIISFDFMITSLIYYFLK